MAPALAPSPIDRNCQDVMDVFLNFCKSVDMSHSVGNCGGLWRSVDAGVMVGGATIGGRSAVWEVVRYILVGALGQRTVISDQHLNRSVGAFIHYPTLLLLRSISYNTYRFQGLIYQGEDQRDHLKHFYNSRPSFHLSPCFV